MSTYVAGMLFLSKAIHGVSLVFTMFNFGALFMLYYVFCLGIYREIYFCITKGIEFLFRTSATNKISDLSWWQPFVIHVLLAALTFLLVKASIRIKDYSKWLVRASYEKIVITDKRDPILFLRSFRDDQVTLPASPFNLKYWLAEPNKWRLDHELVERFTEIAPVVAIGRPGDEDKMPFGAARLYVEDDMWKQTVYEIADRAMAIVLVADETKGVEWEIKTMLEEPYREKTLFLANPQGNRKGLSEHPILAPIFKQQHKIPKNYYIVGAHRVKNQWKLLTSKKFVGQDFVICCQSFFRREWQVFCEETENS